jgi:hypothetical protein
MSNWQLWLNKNYKTISFWAKHWHREEWRELLAFLTLYLQKNWSKFSKIPDGDERIKFLQTWMKNNVRWQNSDFNKSIGVNKFDDEWEIQSETFEEPYEILAEDLPDDVKEFIVDLDRRFTEIEVRQIIVIRKIYLTLPSHERVLYDLYFTQMLSLRQVAKKLQLPLSAVHNMVTDLKKKIKERC